MRAPGCNFRLPIDLMLTLADSYNGLVGNEILRMVSADKCLSTNRLRLGIGSDRHKEVPISNLPLLTTMSFY